MPPAPGDVSHSFDASSTPLLPYYRLNTAGKKGGTSGLAFATDQVKRRGGVPTPQAAIPRVWADRAAAAGPVTDQEREGDLYAGYGVTRGFPLFYRFTIPHRLAKLLPWAEEAGRQARIHTDRRADMIAAGAGAEAVMAGRNIFFRSGRFAPETPRGTALVLHELHHLHQQGRLRQASDWMATERAERESVAVERLAYRILSAKEPRRLQGHAPSHVAATLSLDLARPDRRRQGAGQAPAARSATAGGAAPAPPPMRAADSREVDLPGEHRSPDASEVAAQVFRMLERKLRVDRERLGLGRI